MFGVKRWLAQVGARRQIKDVFGYEINRERVKDCRGGF